MPTHPTPAPLTPLERQKRGWPRTLVRAYYGLCAPGEGGSFGKRSGVLRLFKECSAREWGDLLLRWPVYPRLRCPLRKRHASPWGMGNKPRADNRGLFGDLGSLSGCDRVCSAASLCGV